MQRKQKNTNKRSAKTQRSQKKHIVSRNEINPILPDMVKRMIPFSLVPTVVFNTANPSNGFLINANSINNILPATPTAGTTVYSSGPTSNYQKYRVDRSSIQIICSSREAVNSQFLVLCPTLITTGITTTTFPAYQSLPFAKTTVLGPYVGGQNVCALTQAIDMAKFVGPHYYEQDEYAGTCNNGSPNDPGTKIYWNFGFINPQTNTATTGGMVVQILMEQVVTFYEPARDPTAQFAPELQVKTNSTPFAISF